MTETLRISKSLANRAIASKVLTIVGYVLLVAVSFYVIFAAFALRFVYSNVGVTLVKDSTFTGGFIPAKVEVLIADRETEQSPLSNLQYAFTPQSNLSKVVVEAGPYGEVSSEGPLTSVDGVLLNGKLIDPPKFLSEQYVVSCVEGACGAEGELTVISKKQIVGVTVK